ncbi:MAG TPA: hypothetical protein VES95_09820 [Dermatophilaceae bacterium]|nr:hypothetical protein [Dermatophilaceae bacterium]
MIELEDQLRRLKWYSPLRFASMGVQQWHFVGLVDGAVRYESGTFAAPWGWGVEPLGKAIPPREEWAPGIEEALDELRTEITADGWAEVECGARPWQHTYRKRT